MSVDAAGLGAVLAGSLFLYAGIKGKTVLGSIQAVVSGKPPSTAPGANPITGTSYPAPGGGGAGGTMPTAGSGQAALQQAAASVGWTGAQWQALANVEMREAGFNPQARNPSSGALGMAQALGHGTAATAGTLGNEYGGYGLTDAQAKAANSGNADAQALWMVNYIKATYGTPEAAWAHEQSAGWY